MVVDKTMLLEILDRLLRQWWTVVAGVCIGATGGVVAMHQLPKVYEAKTKIFVAPPKVPADFVRTTVVDDMAMRMAALEQAVLSRPFMEALIENEFKHAPRSNEDMERLMKAIRSRVVVVVSSGLFEISYRDLDPVRAARVVNTLADLYIAENTKYRTTRAGETTKTIQDIAARIRSELEDQERKIAEFRSAHLYETADRQQANLQLLSARQKDLEVKEAELSDAKEALRVISEMEKDSDLTAAAPVRGSQSQTGKGRVTALERELAALKLRYADAHPLVVAKQHELDDAKAAAAKQEASAPPPPTAPAAPASDPLKAQRAMIEQQIEALEDAAKKIRGEIAVYERRIEQTPLIELQLSELSKGHDVLVEQYKTYQSKVESAKTSQEMEESRKGEQFEVLERARPPALPIQPTPLRVFGIAVVLGLAAFVSPLVLRSLLRPLVFSTSGLRALTPEVPVLVDIPRLLVPEVLRIERRRRLANIGLSVLSATVFLMAVVVLH